MLFETEEYQHFKNTGGLYPREVDSKTVKQSLRSRTLTIVKMKSG